MMLAFYLFAAVVVWLGVMSLRSGLSFAAYMDDEIVRLRPHYSPFASVIAPCRGLDDGFAENIVALFRQDYPAYAIILVTDRSDDASLSVIADVVAAEVERKNVSASIVIAGSATDSGQKVHNLRAAVSNLDCRSEVIVFVDTDARPNAGWLTSLVAPLQDETVGATTGYRWFVPVKGGFATQLRSVWNASIASALGSRSDRNFCWGGSTAIRRSTFERLNVAEHWRGSVSDDFTLTRVLQEAKLPIHFVPACLVASLDSCTARELIEFTNRQLKITRVYAAHLWKSLLVGSFLFCAVFFGGLTLGITRALMGLSNATALILLSIIFVLGAAKAYVRLRAVTIPLTAYKPEIMRSLPAHLLLWPVSSLLFLCNAITAAFSRRIHWRGITYDLRSPTEAVIIARDS